MNQLEAEQLIEEAKQYIGQQLEFYPDEKPWTKPESFTFKSTKQVGIGNGNNTIVVSLNAIFEHITIHNKTLTIPLKDAIEMFKKTTK